MHHDLSAVLATLSLSTAIGDQRIRRFVFGFALGILVTIGIVTLSFCLVACAMADGTEDSGSVIGSTRKNEENPARSIGELRRDLQSFVKRTKNRDDNSEQISAIIDLCLLHQEIVQDPRFQTNNRLKSLRAVAADRLKKCKKLIELQLLRDGRKERRQAGEHRSQVADSEKKEDALFRRTDSQSELSIDVLNDWLASDMQSLVQIAGGPVRLWNYTGGNYAGPLCDYGPDLVRLIESTINPDFWRSNGGSGVIHYYQPLRILVVSGSSRVQDDLTELLRTLRRNSR